jgi:UDPglucose--hexose-1-phosphate uridylyltransferase
MAGFNLTDHPHRRYNPLSREWILVSPHRTQRPWQGQVEQPPPENRPQYDPTCYLCPGNTRAGGAKNPNYEHTFVFTNDYAALLPDTPPGSYDVGGLLFAQSERGTSRVLCFSPRHDLTLAQMERDDLCRVVDAWSQQYTELGAEPYVGYVQIFENRGAMMGASNPHPHGQIWATEHIPYNVMREQEAQADYFREHGHTLLTDYLAVELEQEARIVCANDSFVALVPFWAVWPFETLVISRRPVSAITDLTEQERSDLADILKRVTTRYDNVFKVSFPYSMGFHQRPTDREPHPEWHLHAHFYPPLLRSATVRKFMVGFEMLGQPQRDITPESAAERLREQSEQHYATTTHTDSADGANSNT